MEGRQDEEILVSGENPSPRSWFERTFSTMLPGNMRGNILLLTMATTGMAFTMSHFQAKKIGLLFLLLLMWMASMISYVSNMILY
jgi:hypothetical protein